MSLALLAIQNILQNSNIFDRSRETVLFTPFGDKNVTHFSGFPPTSVSYLKDIYIDVTQIHVDQTTKRLELPSWKAVAGCLLSSVGGDTIFNQNLFRSDTFKQRVIKLQQFYNELVGKIFQNVKI